MRLKRNYKLDDKGKVVRTKDGVPIVTGVRVLAESKNRRQKFSPGMIEGGAAEGWLSLGGGKVTIAAEGGDVVYAIERPPGHYCCHCDAKLDGEHQARAHVASNHKGKASPDEKHPAGYRKDNFYSCVKEGD